MLRLLVCSAVDRSQFSHNKNRKNLRICSSQQTIQVILYFCLSRMYNVFFILIKRTCKVTTKLRITIRVKILNLYSPVFVLFQELLDMKTLTWYWIIYRNPIQLNDSDQHCPWVVHLLICEIWCQRQGVESRGGS